jgi:catechol 2,3-dioxygenase-like lactoylglutathione lyase family enzyme
MKFNGINHLAMATGDMDATIRFWRDLLASLQLPYYSYSGDYSGNQLQPRKKCPLFQ